MTTRITSITCTFQVFSTALKIVKSTFLEDVPNRSRLGYTAAAYYAGSEYKVKIVELKGPDLLGKGLWHLGRFLGST